MTEALYTRTKGKSFAGMGRANDNVTGVIEKGALTYEWKITVPPQTPEALLTKFAHAVDEHISNPSFTFDHLGENGRDYSTGVLGYILDKEEPLPDTKKKVRLFSMEEAKQLSAEIFTEFAPENISRRQTYKTAVNHRDRITLTDQTFAKKTPHGKGKMWSSDTSALTEEGLYAHGTPIGLWRYPPEFGKDKHVWFALDGSGTPLAREEKAEDLITHPLVQRDLAAHGIEIEKTGYYPKYTLILHGAEWVTESSVEKLLIDDLFLKEIELAPNRRPSEAELDEKYPLPDTDAITPPQPEI